MKIELLKSELELALITIGSYDSKTGQLVGGLLSESITLGTKRALQKIQKKLHEVYKEYLEAIQDIKKTVGEDKEKTELEFQELLKEKVIIEAEPFKISQIENISTTSNYNFEIIEKIGV